MTFLRNAWYVACASDELADKPLGRQVCNQEIVFFRDADGTPAALEDYCPHRGLPLSLGFVDGGHLVCGYHGLVMGRCGVVQSMPKQRVDKFPSIRRYPVIERYGFVWIWPGDADAATPDEMPVFEWAEDSRWAYGGGVYHINCDYRLMIDNLMDLTHETYVHADSIGQREIDEAPVATRVEGDTVSTSRFMGDVEAPPFWQMALRENGMPDDVAVDRWQVCRFTLPSHVMIDVGVAKAGRGGIDAASSEKVSGTIVDFLTPETESTMWYFWGMARSFSPENKELTEKIRKGQGEIFAEDLEVLEQQQISLQSNPGRRLMTLDIDAGGRHSRLLIERMLKLECESSQQHRS